MKPVLMKYCELVLVCMLSLLVSACSDSPEGTQRPPTVPSVSMSVSSESVNQGDILEIEINVSDLAGVSYAAFDLSYDHSVIEYISAKEGAFFNRGKFESTKILVALENGTPGQLVIGITRLGSIGEISGRGTVVTLSFKAVGSGSSALVFDESRAFKNADKQDIVASWENKTITVL